MRNISDKHCRENQNTCVIFSTCFSDKHVFYETMWKNIVESDRPLTIIRIIRRMRFVCWINKARHTHMHTLSEYVNLIAFPVKQWLGERVSLLRYTYIVCHVITYSYLTSQFLVYNSVHSLNIRYRILKIAAVGSSETFSMFSQSCNKLTPARLYIECRQLVLHGTE